MTTTHGHEQSSRVHREALAHGLHVSRQVNLGPKTTLLEYDGAVGCYAYFADIDGCYRIAGDFDDIVATWPRSETKLGVLYVNQIERRN